jgi:hypothetical protein
VNTTPLPEKERDTCCPALTENVYDPLFLHRTGTSAAFASYNDPVDSSQVNFPQMLE